MNSTEKKDLRGYAFIRNQIMSSGETPSLREIGRFVGYNSPRSVQLLLERLKKRRLLSYSHGVIRLAARGAKVLAEQTVSIPLVGGVACGTPMLAEQQPEAIIDVSTKIAKPGHTYFLLRAVGTSMNKSGIKNGDLVLVRQQPAAEQGERVVALINSDATIKHFYHQGDIVLLKPNSTDKSHKSIVLMEDLMIQGVVAATLPANLY
ncbi:MAG: transcriptional repressor LexA [bacterium]